MLPVPVLGMLFPQVSLLLVPVLFLSLFLLIFLPSLRSASAQGSLFREALSDPLSKTASVSLSIPSPCLILVISS